jgi:hypothetical protein
MRQGLDSDSTSPSPTEHLIATSEKICSCGAGNHKKYYSLLPPATPYESESEFFFGTQPKFRVKFVAINYPLLLLLPFCAAVYVRSEGIK